MNKTVRSALSLIALAAGTITCPPAGAHTELDGYSQFGESRIIRDTFGNCVRSGTWTVERMVKACGAAAAPTRAAPPAEPSRAAAVPPPPPPEPPAPPPPRAPEPMPEPAEVKALQAPPPAEAATVAPASTRAAEPPRVETLSVGAEALFDVSKASLKPAARTQLDALVAGITASPFKQVRVAGHTDRTGSAARNRKLSQQRAEAVKAYLVSKGIPASVIVAEGRGSAEPRTAVTECEGLDRTRLAACLQPDRRVEIEVKR